MASKHVCLLYAPERFLEELIGEISSLASVYHKPEETFIGRGRIGADSISRRAGE